MSEVLRRTGVVAILIGERNEFNLYLKSKLESRLLPDNVVYFSELLVDQVFNTIETYLSVPVVIFLALFDYEPDVATSFIGNARKMYPHAQFTIVIDRDEFEARHDELHPDWQSRLSHYHKLYKVPLDVDIEPVVHRQLKKGIRLSLLELDKSEDNLSIGLSGPDKESSRGMIFISYARADYDEHVKEFKVELNDLGFRTWVDVDFIPGGEMWMDVIGEALDKCDALLLVVTQQSLDSPNVKMEYRDYIHQGRPLIPVLFESGLRLPYELRSINYLDFTEGSRMENLKQLERTIVSKLNESK